MKVGCQQCGAAYSVADEKVAGRKLKLRCKKCGEAIVVDATSQAAVTDEAQSESASFGTEFDAPIASSGAEWHVAIGETTQGPYTIEELAEYYADGNIVLDTLIYRTGWPDWVQAGEVAELQSASAALRSQGAPAPLPSIPVSLPVRAHAFTSATMGSDPFDEAAVSASPRVQAEDMFSSSTRHEGTVQFSLDEMRALSAVSAPSAAPVAPPRAVGQNRPGYASGEGSGLIDMAALVQMQQQQQAEPVWKPMVGDSSPLDISPLDITMAPMSLPVAPAHGLDFRTKVFASLAAFGFALLGGLGVLAFTRQPTQPQMIAIQPVAATQPIAAPTPQAEPVAQPIAVKEAAPEPVAATTPDPAEVAPSEPIARAERTSHTTGKTSKAKASTGASDEAKPSKHGGKAAPAESDDPIERIAKANEKEKPAPAKGGSVDLDDLLLKGPAKPAAKKSTNIDDLLDDAVSAKKAPKKEAAEPKSDLPATPSREDMQAAYGKIKGKTAACKGSGVATAMVSISSSGKVASVEVSGVEGAAKSCVESAVRSTSFPKFTKDSFQVKFPFKLGG